MKILEVITSLQVGGAEHIVVELAIGLKTLGHDVDVVVFNGEDSVFMGELKRTGCKVYRFGKSYYNPLYIIKLVQLMRQYDVIHTHNSSPQLFVALANIFCHKKIITTEHNTNNRKRHNIFLSIIDKWMYTHYDRIICISDIAEKLLRVYIGEKNTKRISTINNGVDVDAIHDVEADGKLLKLKENRKAIVMVAGFREAKDQDTLVRTLDHLDSNKFELWLVGIGVRQDIVINLVKEINEYREEKIIVRFLGLRSDVPNVLKAADIVVMSSHWEGLSLSNIEGMSAGKPFVASDVNGLREVTKDWGLLFPHEDDKALAEIINRLGSDAEYYNEISDRCYRRAKMFDISKMVEEYNKVIVTLNN